MAIITWNDEFSVGIQLIDDQHKRLIEIINELHDAMGKGEGAKAQAHILAELVDYTAAHFKEEEKLFDLYDYPEKFAHKAVHDKLTQQVIDFQKDYENGKTIISLVLMNFLKNWLMDHILNVDKRYTEFLNDKGVH